MILGGACLIGSIVAIVKDTTIKIEETETVIGEVTKAGLTQRHLRKRTQIVYLFKLRNSYENFTIYKSDHAYAALERDVRRGDTVKVHYRPKSSEFNLNVYQVEKDNNIIFSYREFKEQKSTFAGILLFVGVVILVMGAMYYTRFNPIKFLLRLTDK